MYPSLFYNETGNEVNAGQEANVKWPDRRERHMDRPDAAPDLFVRGVNLDG